MLRRVGIRPIRGGWRWLSGLPGSARDGMLTEETKLEFDRGWEFPDTVLGILDEYPELLLCNERPRKNIKPQIALNPPSTSPIDALGQGGLRMLLPHDGETSVETVEEGKEAGKDLGKYISISAAKKGNPWLSLRASMSSVIDGRQEFADIAILETVAAMSRISDVAFSEFFSGVGSVLRPVEIDSLLGKSSRTPRGMCSSWRMREESFVDRWDLEGSLEVDAPMSAAGRLGCCERLLEMTSGEGVTEREATLLQRLCIEVGNIGRAREYLEAALSSGARVRSRTFSPLLAAAAEHGKAEEAHRLMSTMHEMGVTPLGSDWCSLVKSHRNSENFERVMDDLARHRIRPDGELLDAIQRTVRTCTGWEAEVVDKVDEDENAGGLGRLMSLVADLGSRHVRSKEKTRAMSQFRNFRTWLRRHGPFDAVIDGANVAHHRRRAVLDHSGKTELVDISLGHVDAVARALSNAGLRVLIVLHQRWFSEDSTSLSSSSKRFRASLPEVETREDVLQRWEDGQATVFRVPRHANDDWYWLFAAMWSEREKKRLGYAHTPCVVVSNDGMVDHRWSVLTGSEFATWRETRTVAFDVGPEGGHPTGIAAPPSNGYLVAFDPPPKCPIYIQKHADSTFYIPTFGNAVENLRASFTRANHTDIDYLPLNLASPNSLLSVPTPSTPPKSQPSPPPPPVQAYVTNSPPREWLRLSKPSSSVTAWWHTHSNLTPQSPFQNQK